MPLSNLPEFKPDIPEHLLKDMSDKDRWLHEQSSLTQQMVRHVAGVQAASTAERTELLKCVMDLQGTVQSNHTAFVEHVANDARVFREQAEWQRRHDEDVRTNFAALKWLRFDTYFNAKTATKLLLGVVTALLTALALKQFVK